MVRIIVDSTADLRPETRQRVGGVPLTIHFGKEEYVDGVTITGAEFYKKLAACRDLPTTSQAAPYAFAEAFEEAVEAGDTVVCIVVSSALSGTCQSAMIAAADYPGKVYVVDSRSIAIGASILTEFALDLADKGMTAAQIAAELEAVKEKVHLFAVVDTLEYLQRGGRLSKTVAIAGGLLSVKPIITLEDGSSKMAGKARGNKQANALMDAKVRELGIDWDKPCMLGYTGTDDELLQKYRAQSEIWTGDVFSTIVCGVVGTHAGPGAVAVAFFSK